MNLSINLVLCLTVLSSGADDAGELTTPTGEAETVTVLPLTLHEEAPTESFDDRKTSLVAVDGSSRKRHADSDAPPSTAALIATELVTLVNCAQTSLANLNCPDGTLQHDKEAAKESLVKARRRVRQLLSAMAILCQPAASPDLGTVITTSSASTPPDSISGIVKRLCKHIRDLILVNRDLLDANERARSQIRVIERDIQSLSPFHYRPLDCLLDKHRRVKQNSFIRPSNLLKLLCRLGNFVIKISPVLTELATMKAHTPVKPTGQVTQAGGVAPAAPYGKARTGAEVDPGVPGGQSGAGSPVAQTVLLTPVAPTGQTPAVGQVASAAHLARAAHLTATAQAAQPAHSAPAAQATATGQIAPAAHSAPRGPVRAESQVAPAAQAADLTPTAQAAHLAPAAQAAHLAPTGPVRAASQVAPAARLTPTAQAAQAAHSAPTDAVRAESQIAPAAQAAHLAPTVHLAPTDPAAPAAQAAPTRQAAPAAHSAPAAQAPQAAATGQIAPAAHLAPTDPVRTPSQVAPAAQAAHLTPTGQLPAVSQVALTTQVASAGEVAPGGQAAPPSPVALTAQSAPAANMAPAGPRYPMPRNNNEKVSTHSRNTTQERPNDPPGPVVRPNPVYSPTRFQEPSRDSSYLIRDVHSVHGHLKAKDANEDATSGSDVNIGGGTGFERSGGHSEPEQLSEADSGRLPVDAPIRFSFLPESIDGSAESKPDFDLESEYDASDSAGSGPERHKFKREDDCPPCEFRLRGMGQALEKIRAKVDKTKLMNSALISEDSNSGERRTSGVTK